jgi:ribosome-associated protein
MAVLFEDSRQQKNQHELKRAHFEREGWQVERTKLFVGDYMLPGGLVSVDTKRDIYEVAQNLKQQHERFRRECVKAMEAGYRLVVLVENEEGVRDLYGLADWVEPESHFIKRYKKSGGKVKRRYTGTSLYKACKTMTERYGVEFQFCSPQDAGARVLSILKGGEHGDRDDA